MADFKDRLDGYVQVNERIIAFYKEFPEGCLQSEIVEFTNAVFGPCEMRTGTDKYNREYKYEFWPVITKGIVTVKARAYRHPEDKYPGVGHSSLEIPGTTPYTEGSELENAETSAWGRALAALGFEVKRGIATRDEITSKRGQVDEPKKGGKVKAKPDQELKGVEICRARGHHNTQKIIDADTGETSIACIDCGKAGPKANPQGDQGNNGNLPEDGPSSSGEGRTGSQIGSEQIAALKKLVEDTKAPLQLMMKQYAKGRKYEEVDGEIQTDITPEEYEKLKGVLENRKKLQEEQK